ncbi:hypothetical protein [Calorimonas adulescens]|jgi:hypothetical protein|uniref:DUF2007 domain-containing protein n=1 Tax=Calorimonas adulescens TaxID=2606906 RepID=A0A5D8QBB8_9THEO|nr:hypothetical protein [Calorimonas adulescens]TZE81076.1 hypothetical protein FWJ32_10670 [Calorimonas adulescens]
MDNYIKIAVLDNEVEARLLEEVLKERGIPYVIRSYHDAAYDGIFQIVEGWGYVASFEDYSGEIMQILSDIRIDGRE